MTAIEATTMSIICDAIDGKNMEFNFYNYNNPTMWKDILEGISEVEKDVQPNFLKEDVVKDVIDCYGLSTAIVNTPEEDVDIIVRLKQRFVFQVEEFIESFMEWYNAVMED